MQDDETPLETAINIVKQKDYPSASRLHAIRYLVEKGSTDECSLLLEEILLDVGEEADVRCAAALALGKLGGDRALELLKQMAQGEDKTLKNYSLHGLGMLGREEAIPDLLNALKDEDNTIFASAAEALGRVGRPVVPHLINLLKTSPADDARCIAAWQLGTLRYTEAVTPLLEVVRNEGNPELVALSIWALGEIGFGPEDVLETLNQARAHEDPSISQRAVMAIKKISRHVN